MENTKIKKVTVELENGNVLEFDKNVILFAEDEMTATEQKIHTEQTKMCTIASCNSAFMGAAASSALDMLTEHEPALEALVLAKHMASKHRTLSELLDSILG